MELYEANRILRTVKSAISADGYKLPASAETDGLLMLLGRLDIEKHLAPKIKHAKAQAKQPKSAAAYARSCKLIYFFRALQAATELLSDPVTVQSMTALHKAITGDVNDDAGKLRTTDAATDGNAHTDPKYISGSVKSIIAQMNDIPAAPATAKEDFAGYLSHYMRELIILHPFESCSEFTVRIFIFTFCRLKGFALAYHRATHQALKAAEQTAFTTDDVAELYSVFTECLTYDHKKSESDKPFTPRTRREVAKDLHHPARKKDGAQDDKQKAEKKKTKSKSKAKAKAKAIAEAQIENTANADDEQTQRQNAEPTPNEEIPNEVVKNDDEAGKKEAVKKEVAKKNKEAIKKEKDAAKKEAANDDVIKRAVRLQQKISKLNEQLTELIKPLDGKDEN
ncbi:MAG: Fic family protein [Clostridiales bacterium]|nr:Fic family protein [Clostridiales bacterium]